MTGKQRGMLFGLWKQVAAQAGWSKDEAEAQRTEFTIAVLKPGPRDEIPSWGSLKPGQIDALMGALNQRLRGGMDLVQTPAGLMSAAEAAHYERLVFGIEADAVAAYADTAGAEQALATTLESMLQRTFAPGDWRKLPVDDLEKLRMHTAGWKRAKFAKLA